MLSYTLVDAFTRRDRHEAMARLKRAIVEADGVIVDFAFYRSAIRLSVELEAGAVARLCAALEASDLHLFERHLAPPSATNLVVAMVHVTLANETEEDAARESAA
jgi:hypothetical protein